MKFPLTAEQQAAILAGAVEIEVDVEAAGQQATAGAPNAETETPAGAPAAAASPVAAPVEGTPAASTAAAAADAGASTELVSFLKGELSTANANLVNAQVEIAQLKAAAAGNDECMPKLLAITRGIVGNMSVALGGNATAAQAMDAKAVVAEHERLQPLFAAKFKVGGVAVTTPPEPTPAKPALDPAFQSRLASTR
jgi:hypothetical protein